ncbi:hypothetical protein SEUCBS139899_007688 [Sporothrix eucalyptigena]|uniref:Uncharacterized protein n=1 Tax=Sporothrix eucalyptigena TaxID=1812306 RepID=A0ABP0CEM2_9PEZI
MANPPVLRNWRCPAHADDIVAKLPGQLGPAHRFRKIKGAPAIKPAYSRGMINNGFIEFSSDSDSDNNSGWKHLQSFGRVQRIGARGVQLDFLEQIRKEQPKGRQRHARIQRQQEIAEFRPVVDVEVVSVTVDTQPAVQVDHDVLHDRSFIDHAQAAHNLTALRGSEEQIDRTGDLINALLAQADTSVISMMAQGSPLNIMHGSTLTQEDRTALQAMRARIEFLLGNPVPSASLEETKEHSSAASQKDNAPKTPETPATEAQVVPDVPMEDALADEGEQPESTDQAVLETNEVMSLVSDNGENEDEDPPPITTPLNAPDDEPNSAVWPVEHGSSISDPDTGNGAIQATTKTDLGAPGINSFPLCDHGNGKGSLRGASEPKTEPEEGPDTVVKTGTVDDVVEQIEPDTSTNNLSSPLTPLRTSSETAVEDEDDKENTALTERLDKQSEQPDNAIAGTEVRTETNDSVDN